jgi:hypothetical protein
MSRKTRRIQKLIERAGGMAWIDKDLPDDLAQQFLEEILHCPDCAAALTASQQRSEHGKKEH